MPASGTADDRTPSHYRGGNNLQPWDVIDAFHLDYYEGTLIAYLLRKHSDHDGRLDDLYKARHYLDRVISRAQDDAPP